MAKKAEEPQFYTSATNNQMLNYRVYKMKSGEKLLYFLMCFVVGGLVGLVFYGGLFKKGGVAGMATLISNVVVFCIVGAAACKMFIPVINESLRKKRINILKLQFRDFLGALSNSLSSGMNINDSIQNAKKDMELQYSSDAYIVAEVGEMVAGIQNNIDIENVIKDFGYRSGIDDITNFATVFSICYRSGGNIKDIIKRTTELITEKMMVAEEIETKITSNKTQMMAMNVIPVVVVLMMKNMSSEFAKGLTSVIGVIAISVAVVLFVIAYIVGQKIMNIEG